MLLVLVSLVGRVAESLHAVGRHSTSLLILNFAIKSYIASEMRGEIRMRNVL